MGLKDRLQQAGSSLTAYDGNTPPINPLATNQSTLHAIASGQPGYSVSGINSNIVNGQYQQYQDGAPNSLPFPSNLDLNNGFTPFQYLNNPPH
jgi:hypothetical protein